jgi:hypothetical protein
MRTVSGCHSKLQQLLLLAGFVANFEHGWQCVGRLATCGVLTQL